MARPPREHPPWSTLAHIAKRAGIARGRVSVVRGERSREKVVRVDGLAHDELRSALGLASGTLPSDIG